MGIKREEKASTAEVLQRRKRLKSNTEQNNNDTTLEDKKLNMIHGTALDALREISIIVTDSSDINKLKEFHPQDATTNPTLVFAAAQMPEYKDLVIDAIEYGKTKGSSSKDRKIDVICDRLLINFGKEILKTISGVVSTEVDATYSFDINASVEKAKRLIAMYEEVGIDRSRVLVKLASTWEGLKSAEILEKQSIHCNMTLMFSLCQVGSLSLFVFFFNEIFYCY